MIKYLGSKRLLIQAILESVQQFEGVHTVLDLFSGTSRVGHALKRGGYRVIANDHNAYAATLARCYVVADRTTWWTTASDLIAHLQQVSPETSWFTEQVSVRSRYFQVFNAAKIEGIRNEIERLSLPEPLRSIALVSLMEAADRVDSTTGLQMAYLKQWSERSYQPLELRMPDLVDGESTQPCEAHQLDARVAAKQLSADLVYLDPPYNQHSYLGNYHVWETLVLWDQPECYGVATKRMDVRSRSSVFNQKSQFELAFREVIQNLSCEGLIVSFSNEGFLCEDQLVEILQLRGKVTVKEIDYPRYVGARIGIHSPRGQRVGTVSHVRNVERLFMVA